MWCYQHCGLTVASDLAIPGLEAADASGEADVRLVLGDASGPVEWSFAASNGECRFTSPATGSYEVHAGRRILVHPRPHADPQAMCLCVLGSAWGAVLQQRGAFALHAGITADADGATAFCGPPAAGKSSTVAWLVRRGHAFVSDDLTRLEVPADGPPQVWPSAPRLKLSSESLRAGRWTTEGVTGPLVDGKHHVDWDGARVRGPLPLRTVYVLAWGQPAVTRLRGGEAVRRFAAAATYRPQLVDHMPALLRHWQQCLEIARRVPIWELSRPRDWSDLDQVLDR